MRNEVFFAIYTSWSLAWIVVMLTYAQGANQSWRDQGGAWIRIPRDAFGFFKWFAFNFWQDVRHGFRPYEEAIPHRYTQGHLLRFFITLGALVAGVMGFSTATLDRTDWGAGVAALMLCAVSFSTISALGHLSVAWQHKPRRWRLFVLFLLVWMFAAADFYGAIQRIAA